MKILIKSYNNIMKIILKMNKQLKFHKKILVIYQMNTQMTLKKEKNLNCQKKIKILLLILLKFKKKNNKFNKLNKQLVK